MSENIALPPPDQDRRAFDPMSYPPPKGWQIVAWRHYTSQASPWDFVLGWSAKAVYRYREDGGITAQKRIPDTVTYLLLIRTPKEVRRHGK